MIWFRFDLLCLTPCWAIMYNDVTMYNMYSGEAILDGDLKDIFFRGGWFMVFNATFNNNSVISWPGNTRRSRSYLVGGWGSILYSTHSNDNLIYRYIIHNRFESEGVLINWFKYSVESEHCTNKVFDWCHISPLFFLGSIMMHLKISLIFEVQCDKHIPIKLE